MKNNVVAIMYDFDKTLCTENTIEYSFVPNLGIGVDEFWEETNQLRDLYKMDQVLSYMYIMRKKMMEQNKKLDREYLQSMGKDIEFFPGVLEWFDRINKYGRELGLEIEHYVLSSGLIEIIEGSPVGDKFKCIFASEFLYDEEGNAVWPNLSVNYTSKTQFLTRINKGILDVSNNSINDKMVSDDRRIPTSNMIYIGDGFTDIPCMKLTKDKGGISIAVYTDDSYHIAKKIFNDGRTNYIALADYSTDSKIDNIIKEELKKIASNNNLNVIGEVTK